MNKVATMASKMISAALVSAAHTALTFTESTVKAFHRDTVRVRIVDSGVVLFEVAVWREQFKPQFHNGAAWPAIEYTAYNNDNGLTPETWTRHTGDSYAYSIDSATRMYFSNDLCRACGGNWRKVVSTLANEMGAVIATRAQSDNYDVPVLHIVTTVE